MTILRTQRDGVWELRSNAWGTFLAPTVDPLADTVITQDQLDGFELNPDIPKIPNQLWSIWVNLCIEMCKRGTGDLEVSCRFLRHVEDPSRYRIAVPVQKVSGASVRVESFDKAIDIETGEAIDQWPPEGWRPCGSSHSHNTMGAFFSSTDDKYELGDPGLHIVVGKIDINTGQHEVCASVTANQRRFLLDPFSFIPETIDREAPVPDACYEVITVPKPLTSLSNSVSWGWGTGLTTQSTGYKLPSYTYEGPTENEITALVADELKAIREAVDQLIVSGTARGLNLNGVLSDLANEIDDASYFTDYSDKLNDPPLTWKDDYVF